MHTHSFVQFNFWKKTAGYYTNKNALLKLNQQFYRFEVLSTTALPTERRIFHAWKKRLCTLREYPI